MGVKGSAKIAYAIGLICSLAMLGMSIVGLLVFGKTEFILGTAFFGVLFAICAILLGRSIFRKSKTIKSRTQPNSETETYTEKETTSNDFH